MDDFERQDIMKTAMRKLMFAAFAAVALFTLSARAATVPYVDEHGASLGSASCAVITGGTKTMGSGWYAVTSNTSNSNRIEVTGSVDLILCDGATLTSYLGIEVPAGKSLTIWGQSGGTGRFNVVFPNEWSAGIGGSLRAGFGSITIRGGNISTTGHQGAAGIGGGYDGAPGTIDIRGGTITATTADDGCVGIGAGYKQGCGTITISGGTITVAGGLQAAGIGTTRDGTGGTITITGGSITATGGDSAAGIGSGLYGTLDSITITGGNIAATGGKNGAGVGTGYHSSVGTLRISGATVNATGGGSAAGVGGGASGSGTALVIENSAVTAQGGMYGAGIGSGEGYSDVSHQGFGSIAITGAGSEIHATGGLLAAGIGGGMRGGTGDVTISGGTIVATGGDGGGAGIGGGWFGGDGTVTINSGDITATAGQKCSQCYDCGAGIGGGDGRYLRSVVINGGDITAIGGYRSAGIGGGSSRFFASELENGKTLEELETNGTVYIPGVVTINSGTIWATGGEQASGIGSGGWAPGGGIVNINGGNVTATGDQYGAGIGGGWTANGGTVNIRNGTVVATGGKYGAGIGGGYEASGGTVAISGGRVAANGGYCAAGIGGGSNTTFEDSTDFGGGTVVITGGTVTATGGNGGQLEFPWPEIYGAGAGIGGGWRGSGADVTISGGTVIATPGDTGSDDTLPQAIGRGTGGDEEGALVLTPPADGSCMRAGTILYADNIHWYPGNLAYPCRQVQLSAIIESGIPHEYDAQGHCAYCGDSNGPVLPSAPYVDAGGAAQGAAIFLPLTASAASWHVSGAHGGWYAVTNDLAIPSRVTVSGNVNLILCDGASLTAPKGIEVTEGNSLTIWRQSDATGVLLTGTTNGTDATCDSGNAAIGGDSGENAGVVTVNGGNITAVAGAGAQAIGHGAGATGAGDLHLLRTMVFDGVAATEPVGHAQRDAVCRSGWARLADCLEHVYVHGICQHCGLRPPIGYYNPAGRRLQTTADYIDYLGQTALGDGWYVLFEDLETSDRITVSGDANLILCDGATWNARAGIDVGPGSSLTIWAQSNGDAIGALVAVGGDGQSGIGGTDDEAGGTVTVYGGAVSATGGIGGAGIGGGTGGSGGDFTFRGGMVTATAGTGAQAIGHGAGGDVEGGLAFAHARVYDGVAATEPVATAERENGCRGAWVRLEPCTEHALQDGFCRYCGKPAVNIYQDTTLPAAPYQSCADCTAYSGQLELSGGWYVVDSSMRVEGRIEVGGDVNLILCDDSELTAASGIHVPNGNSLTIWAQSQDDYTMGALVATGAEDGMAGIGGNPHWQANGPGGRVIVNGGKVTAIGGSYAAGIGGGRYDGGDTVTVNGGVVTVVGGARAAGLGGGGSADGGMVVINGGMVTATGGYDTAGIGSGSEGAGGSVTIRGGTVRSTGGYRGAGIGGSHHGAGGTINISGGTVVATGDYRAAGIGGGWEADGGNITISGGTVAATGGKDAAGIGGGFRGTGGNITISGGTVTATAGNRGTAIGGGYLAGDNGILNIARGCKTGLPDGSGAAVEWAPYDSRMDICRRPDDAVHVERCESHSDTDADVFCDLCGLLLQPFSTGRVAYRDSTDGDRLVQRDCALYAGQLAMTSGWYAVTESQIFNGRLAIVGDVNLILCDGAELTTTGGVHVAAGHSLTFWAQGADNGTAGRLTVTASAAGNAGIGGNVGEGGGAVTVYGGVIAATGGAGGAGIGGGAGGSGGDFALSGGMVTVAGGEDAQAIGRGGGGGDSGILALDATYRVGLRNSPGGAWEWAAPGSRTNACRDAGGAVVRLERCKDHADSDSDYRCDYCGVLLRNVSDVPYLDPVSGTRPVITNCLIYTGEQMLNGGWYAVAGRMTIEDRLEISGDVNLILRDGAELTLPAGIHVAGANSLTIWAQSDVGNACGALSAAAPDSNMAGIGGNNNESGGQVTINGGSVLAVGNHCGAGIGSGRSSEWGSGGTITINGGRITAEGGRWAAGIGGAWKASGGNITINGGTVMASGGYFYSDPYYYCGAGIGAAHYGNGGTITINGGMVTAVGAYLCPGIGGGNKGPGGTITIIGGVVTAIGDGTEAIGAGANNSDSGSLCIDGMRVGTVDGENAVTWVNAADRISACHDREQTVVILEPCASHLDANDDMFCDYCGGYCGPVPPSDADGAFLIASANDWNVFASSVAAGMHYAGETVKLAADIGPVSTMVGTGDHSFRGIFDGDGHTLTVAIDSAEQCAAPFSGIDGATIHDLTVAGTVTSSAFHAAGLVGSCGANGPNVLVNCTVAATVNGYGYAGGIVGHGGQGTLTMDGCVFSGAVNGFSAFAGGLMGWSNSMTLTVANCLSAGTFAPADGGVFHPIACKRANQTVTASVADAYYLNTVIPTTMGGNLVPGAEGVPVSASLVEGGWATPVTAADGNTYYAWASAPAGRLLAHLSFDDYGNGGLNLLRAGAGQDAIVRATPTTPVEGIGEIAAVSEADILSGLSEGDGAAAIPKGQYFAVPIPAALLSAHGRPYTIVMRIRVPNTVGWRGLINMPASNDTDEMIYLQQTTRNVYLKQFDKTSGSGIPAANGFVEADRWTTLAFAFGENATDIYRDGTLILHTDGKALAGSYADCASAGGYILVGADDNGDDDLFYLSDFRVYEGAVAVSEPLPGSGTPKDPYIIASAADWDAFASNVNAGADAGACYRLAADIAVTSMVGTLEQPFRGVFHGNDYTLTVNISSAEAFASPFRQIDGAVIMNLAVDGTVTSSAYHASGLVGSCGNGNPSVIHNCTVAATVNGSGYAGGIVGHGGNGTLTIEGCVFSGAISGFANHAGGILGWCDALTLNIANCLTTGTFTPTGNGKYHPVACKYAVETVAATIDRAYYLNTITPNETGANLISGAEGTPVSETYVAGEWTRPVTAADGFTYYVAATGYEIWAAANDVAGTWNATDANGIHNVFRYAFDKPTGVFTNPPLLSISFDANGNPVILTPPLANAEGFDLSIRATDSPDGANGQIYPLNASGETAIPASGKKSRFFRLRAVER